MFHGSDFHLAWAAAGLALITALWVGMIGFFWLTSTRSGERFSKRRAERRQHKQKAKVSRLVQDGFISQETADTLEEVFDFLDRAQSTA